MICITDGRAPAATERFCNQGVSANMTPSTGSGSCAGWHETGEAEECAAMERWWAGSRTENNAGLLLDRLMENMGVLHR